MITVIKEIFYERVKSWQSWKAQQQLLEQKIKEKNRFDFAGKSAQAKVSDEAVKNIKEKVEQTERKFLEIKEVIRNEYDQYCKQLRQEMKATIIGYLEALLENEKRVRICLFII